MWRDNRGGNTGQGAIGRPTLYSTSPWLKTVCRRLSVLLTAGADEAATACSGVCASQMVGSFVKYGGVESNPSTEAATAAPGRMLKRAPAFRAQSWVWDAHSGASAAAADCRRDGGCGAILSPREGAGRVPLGVRIFRPRNRKVFVKLIGR